MSTLSCRFMIISCLYLMRCNLIIKLGLFSYPNIEIKTDSEGANEKIGKDNIIWRSGTHRVRADKHCASNHDISAGEFCEDYCSGGLNHNYDCGGGTITLNTCGKDDGEPNWDKVCIVSQSVTFHT